MEGRGDRFLDDVQHVQAGQLACPAGGLALGDAEVGRHRYDDIADRLAGLGAGILRELPQDNRRYRFRGVGAAVEFTFPALAHLALDQRDDRLRVKFGDVLGIAADDDIVRILEIDHGRSRLIAVRIPDDLGVP